MDEKKIAYLKKHLEQALDNDDYNEVNSCYQDLLKFVNAADIPDLVQKVNDYNSTHTRKPSPGAASAEDIIERTRIAKKKHNAHTKISLYGMVGGFVGMIIGFLFLMVGAGVISSNYSDFVMYSGLAVAIAGLVVMILGVIFLFVKNKSEDTLTKCRDEVFKLICDGEDKLKYLENVETIEDLYYIGQVQEDEPNGFGVGLRAGGFVYIGQWKYGSMCGVGKLISDDMLMTLEGEFADDQPDGIVDIQWEDGSQWHGEYKEGNPWSGEGKALVGDRIREGVWKNGLFIPSSNKQEKKKTDACGEILGRR